MADAAIAACHDGHDVFFITVDPKAPFHSGKGREKMVNLVKAERGIHIVSSPADHLFEFGTDDFRAKTYIDLIRKNVPPQTPLIVSDDPAVWDAAAYVADKYPMIGVLHGNDEVYYNNARKYARQLSVCICVANRVKKNLIKNCPEFDQSKTAVIPCGINMPGFLPTGKSNGVLKLIFIGRIKDKVKRATDLVKIAALLHKSDINFHLDIVGNDEESGKEFLDSFREAGVGGSVTFRGWLARPEIQKLLNSSDILLLTSNSEGMPLVMMEALASGCGFTGTRISGIEDYESHPLAKDCLSVYTVGDIEDAVAKIKALAAVPIDVRRHAARKLAMTEFNMMACLDKYFHLIAQIKTAPPPARNLKLSVADMLYSKTLALARYAKVSLQK
jgi:glycosyltransferase involved in cell wall biosynthesis